MLCSDLERYLEAYLDGRLGRSRTTILRRHLGMCAPCRARVERLRRFEREVGRQLGGGEPPAGAGRRQPSVWQGLEVDLVRSFSVGGTDIIPLLRPMPPGAPRLRPATPSRAGAAGAGTAAGGRGRRQGEAGGGTLLPPGLRRRASRLAGVLAVALAAGTLYEFARAWLVPEDPAEEAVQAYLDFADGRHDLALRTADAASLQNWFAAQLGRSFPPPPVPAGFELVGGARAEIARHDAAVIVYAVKEDERPQADPGLVDAGLAAEAPPAEAAVRRPTLLFVQAAEPTLGEEERSTPPVPLEVAGFNQLAWEAQPYSFRLVSAEPPTRLREFAP